MLKRIADAWGKRKQDSGRFAPAPVLKVDNALFSTPEAPESDGAGTLTTLSDPWKELMARADKQNMSPEEYNAMIREYYHDDMHRAMLIREASEPKPSGSSKVEPSEEGDYKHGFM